MAFLNDRILDNGLSVLPDEADRIDVCSTEPTTFAEATTTLSLGNKLSPAIGAPADRSPSGRKVAVAAFSDGVGTADGTPGFCAITDTANERLLAVGALDDATAVTDGNPFSLAAFDVGIPDPA